MTCLQAQLLRTVQHFDHADRFFSELMANALWVNAQPLKPGDQQADKGNSPSSSGVWFDAFTHRSLVVATRLSG